MKKFAMTSLVLSLAVGSLASTPAVASAQNKGEGSQILPASTTVKVGNGNGLQRVTVTVLGALQALTGTQLYFFPDPFDPVTGQFAPHKRVAIGPSAFGDGSATPGCCSNSTDARALQGGTAAHLWDAAPE